LTKKNGISFLNLKLGKKSQTKNIRVQAQKFFNLLYRAIRGGRKYSRNIIRNFPFLIPSKILRFFPRCRLNFQRRLVPLWRVVLNKLVEILRVNLIILIQPKYFLFFCQFLLNYPKSTKDFLKKNYQFGFNLTRYRSKFFYLTSWPNCPL